MRAEATFSLATSACAASASFRSSAKLSASVSALARGVRASADCCSSCSPSSLWYSAVTAACIRASSASSASARVFLSSSRLFFALVVADSANISASSNLAINSCVWRLRLEQPRYQLPRTSAISAIVAAGELDEEGWSRGLAGGFTTTGSGGVPGGVRARSTGDGATPASAFRGSARSSAPPARRSGSGL